jgi:hypothetical protein
MLHGMTWQSEKDRVVGTNDVLKRKVQWTFLVSLVFARKAFPQSEDAQVQAGAATDMVAVGVNTQPGASLRRRFILRYLCAFLPWRVPCVCLFVCVYVCVYVYACMYTAM